MNSAVVVHDLAIIVAAKNHNQTIFNLGFRLKRFILPANSERVCHE